MKNALAVSRYMLSQMLRDLQMIATTYQKELKDDVSQKEIEHITSAIVHITMVCAELRKKESENDES